MAHGNIINLEFLDYVALEAVRRGDIWRLCGLFQELLESIGFGTVICMIDGIAWYKGEARKKETDQVMRFLGSLVDAVQVCQNGFVFKLLVTSSVASHEARSWFTAAAELFLYDKVHSGG